MRRTRAIYLFITPIMVYLLLHVFTMMKSRLQLGERSDDESEYRFSVRSNTPDIPIAVAKSTKDTTSPERFPNTNSLGAGRTPNKLQDDGVSNDKDTKLSTRGTGATKASVEKSPSLAAKSGRNPGDSKNISTFRRFEEGDMHVHYNRTTILQCKSSVRPISPHIIVTFAEGSERQLEKFLSLHPNYQDTTLLKPRNIRDTWNLRSKYRFEIHKPVVVGRDIIIPSVNNAYSMPLYVLQLQLDETISGRASSGGSAFRVISASYYHMLCGFSDLFNGTYHIFCPVYGNNATVSIQLSVIDFQGYQGTTVAFDEYIWQEFVTIKDQTLTDISAIPWFVSGLHKKFASPHGLWTAGERPVYHMNNGDVLVKKTRFMCNCLRSFTVFMTGTSHMTHAFACLYNDCQFYTDYRVMRHVIRGTAGFMREVWNTTLKQWRKSRTDPFFLYMPKDRVFVVQAGSVDLEFSDFLNTTLTELPTFMRNLSTLRERGERVIVIGTPSLPHEGTPPLKTVTRNNQITAVFNKRQSELAQKYGIEFIDMFSVTMPHYRWRPLENGKKSRHYIADGCNGLVGLTALELLVAQLCPEMVQQYDTWTEVVDDFYEDPGTEWVLTEK